jgi:hypothetical protein
MLPTIAWPPSLTFTLLHRQFLLPAGAVPLEGLELHSEGARQLGETVDGAVLLRNVFHICQPAGA